MIMEDDRLRKLFEDFNPGLSPRSRFMARLERNMDAVEEVRRSTVAHRRYNRIAVVVASLAGFVSGVFLTLVYPLVSAWLSGTSLSIPAMGVRMVSIDWQIVCWIVMAVVCVLAAIGAYESTLSRLSARR